MTVIQINVTDEVAEGIREFLKEFAVSDRPVLDLSISGIDYEVESMVIDETTIRGYVHK